MVTNIEVVMGTRQNQVVKASSGLFSNVPIRVITVVEFVAASSAAKW